jgi:hypothetical protein
METSKCICISTYLDIQYDIHIYLKYRYVYQSYIYIERQMVGEHIVM